VHRSGSTPTTYLRPSAPDRPRAGRSLTAILGALALSLAIPALGHAATPATSPPATAPIETVPSKTAPTVATTTESNPNNYECAGHIGAGKAEPGAEGTPVQYEFLCDGLITGYQLQTQLPIAGIEGAPLVTNFQGQPTTNSFSCSGDFPGYAVNCVGAANGVDDRVTGQFSIGWKLCTEPRVDALLTVTYAYLEKGVITQAISGPFDLGRPLGCPATGKSGKDRLTAFQGPEPKKSSKGKKGHGKAKGHGKGTGSGKKTGAGKNTSKRRSRRTRTI
jgi:hypothetical protein